MLSVHKFHRVTHLHTGLDKCIIIIIKSVRKSAQRTTSSGMHHTMHMYTGWVVILKRWF